MENSVMDVVDLKAIANQFSDLNGVRGVEPLGNGIINDTYFVTTDSPTRPHFVLQKVNTQVFRQPHLVMENMCILTEHISQVLRKGDSAKESLSRRSDTLRERDRRWEVPGVLRTIRGENHYIDVENGFWRAISFIPESYSFDLIANQQQAQEIGYALGYFHYLIRDLSPQRLADTLPGFHITPIYLEAYQRVLSQVCRPNRKSKFSHELKYCLQFVEERQNWVSVLENAKNQGLLPLRLMHGDPKINNVMFDRQTHQSISLIDLDTVKPGLIHYDIGDCLRSGCNLLGEETEDWQRVVFDVDICQGILQGYLLVAQEFFTGNDYLYIYDAIRLIPFELGLRFLTDYLAGNVYFKVNYPEHNLARALVQFQLTKSIESQENSIRQIIQSFQ